jgi:hypothetical protein
MSTPDRNHQKVSAYVERIAEHEQTINDLAMGRLKEQYPLEFARALKFVRGAAEKEAARVERLEQRASDDSAA